MATLKSLVDETTNIKNELKTCHTNLKNNLVKKGVECSNTDKMSVLVNKVLDTSTAIPKGVKFEGVSGTVQNSTDIDIQHCRTCRYGNYIYIIGGTTQGSSSSFVAKSSSNIKYDVINGTFTKNADLPLVSSGNYTGVCVVNNRIYIGLKGAGTKDCTIIVTYDADLNTYTTEYQSDLSLGQNCFVAKDNTITMLSSKEVVIYDALTKTLTFKGVSFNNSSNIERMTYTLWNDCIHKLGTVMSGSSTVASHEKYDYSLNTITKLASEGSTATGHRGAVIKNEFYAFGGVTSSELNVRKYDSINNKWIELPRTREFAMDYSSVCVFNDWAYIFAPLDAPRNVVIYVPEFQSVEEV